MRSDSIFGDDRKENTLSMRQRHRVPVMVLTTVSREGAPKCEVNTGCEHGQKISKTPF
jgi:hypothetical protein